jgi:homoserine O-succinyltransferase
MPIRLPSTLPAFDVLRDEGVMVMGRSAADRQDIRPLRIGLLNLMPKKIQTETQFARLIGATPLQVELSLIRMTSHETKNTAAEHMEAFYRPFAEVEEETGEKFDGLIITGAPIEHLPFEDVTYWDELTRVFDWTQTNVHSTFGVCWGGMAMIHHFHGVKKHLLDAKLFGCYRHMNLAPERPISGDFPTIRDAGQPLDRDAPRRDRGRGPAGPAAFRRGRPRAGRGSRAPRALHLQPSRIRQRHAERGIPPRPVARRWTAPRSTCPVNYFPGDDPARTPQNRWRSHAHLLYGNWVSEVYLTTPFDMDEIGEKSTDLRSNREAASVGPPGAGRLHRGDPVESRAPRAAGGGDMAARGRFPDDRRAPGALRGHGRRARPRAGPRRQRQH